jgi:hypothetical protein
MSDASPTLFSESLPLTRQAAEREAAALRAEIARHDELYYQQHAPVISDYDYDQLVKRLQAIEAEFPDLITPDSPTQRIGGRPSEGFASVPHRIRMLSLDNVYSPDELREWEARCRRACDGPFDYVAELKIDGLSLALRYTDGTADGSHHPWRWADRRSGDGKMPVRSDRFPCGWRSRWQPTSKYGARSICLFRRSGGLMPTLKPKAKKTFVNPRNAAARHDEAAGLTGGCQSAAGDVLL